VWWGSARSLEFSDSFIQNVLTGFLLELGPKPGITDLVGLKQRLEKMGEIRIGPPVIHDLADSLLDLLRRMLLFCPTPHTSIRVTLRE
jgi:hypothetical protein